MKAIFLSPQGIIKGNEFPEKPVLNDRDNQWYKETGGYLDPNLWYERTYQHAIDTALEIEDQLAVLDLMFPENLKIETLKPYPVENYSLEKIGNFYKLIPIK